jgi:phosphatidylglycerophosphate synthase
VTRPGADDDVAHPLVLVRATADEAPGANLRVAGLTVIDRAVKQVGRMGYRLVFASDGTVALPPLPAGAEIEQVAGPAGADELRARLGSPPVVSADVVRPTNRDIQEGLRVTDEPSRARAEDAIFAELLRGDLGLVARYLNKPISFRITRYLLCQLPVTPNQVTLGAAGVGLLGCALIATGGRIAIIIGLLLAHLQSILDGCDGELARVRFQQSALGEWLDTVVDDALNLALIAAIGVGAARAHGSPVPLLVGLLTCAMLLTYNAVAYSELVRQGAGGEVLKVRWWFTRGRDLKQLYGHGQRSPFSILTALGRRDFFLLAWVVLSIFGFITAIQVYALLVVVPSFAVAVGQLATRR